MQTILNNVIERVKAQINGESIYSFAKKLGISQQTVDCYINGKRKPSLEFIYRVCSTYGVSADYLLGLSQTQGVPTVSAGAPVGAASSSDSPALSSYRFFRSSGVRSSIAM